MAECRSAPMAGSATFTVVVSSMTSDEAPTVAAITQRPRAVPHSIAGASRVSAIHPIVQNPGFSVPFSRATFRRTG